ncbi:MAG TPA: GGDEF domain-containing protein [Roseiflexaceae bacterium]|nr:GGDEF domain-containing protein [Roseiflexaceae bacterium]
MFDWLYRRAPSQGLALGLGLALVVGALDLLIGAALDLVVLYVAPILLIAWFAGRRAGWIATFLCAGLHTIGALRGCASPIQCIIPVGDFLAAVLIFGVLVELSARLRTTLVTECARARCDTLTGLANRLGFYELAEREMGRSRRSGEALAVVYIDCDGFKAVNDTYGHQGGDEVLSTVGKTLRETVRLSDIAARVGGDEFVLLLPVGEAALVQPLVERIAAGLDRSMQADSWPVTFSIGVVTFTVPPCSVDMLLASADALMYRIKEQGKDGVAYAVVTQHQDGDARLVVQASEGDAPVMYKAPEATPIASAQPVGPGFAPVPKGGIIQDRENKVSNVLRRRFPPLL